LDVLERFTDQRRDLFRPLHLQGPVIDDANDDLLVLDDLPHRLEVLGTDRTRLKCQRVGVDRVERLQCRLIALNLVATSLLTRIAPAVLAPDFVLGAQSFRGVVEYFDEVVDVASNWNHALKPFHDRLNAAGKKPKVTIVAVMRKIVTTLNAIVRDDVLW